MKKTYKELLTFVRDNDIDIGKLEVAYEVANTFGCDTISAKRFENLCTAIYNLWLKTENITVGSLSDALKEVLDNKEYSLNNILCYGEGFDAVIDAAIL